MEMIRTFNSIGHGGFCTEEFGDFIMIYDCGGRNERIIVDEIIHSLKQGAIIDALFISHFHSDHINGLEYLLRNYHVKRVFLPYLHDNQKIQLIVENALYNGNNAFTNDLISDYKTTIQRLSILGEETNVIPVMSNSENNNSNQENVNIESIGNTINSGTPITINTSGVPNEWVFIPFNFRYIINADKIKNALNLIGITNDNILDKLKTDKGRIIEVYKDVLNGERNFNSSSLTLYSGINSNNSNYYIGGNFGNFYIPFRMRIDKVGCLYLGDYNAREAVRWNELDSAYSNYWVRLSTIQIPHHGSFYNYNDRLNSKQGLISIMAANKNSRHPHALTVKAIISNSGFPIIVTEEPSTRFIERILKR